MVRFLAVWCASLLLTIAVLAIAQAQCEPAIEPFRQRSKPVRASDAEFEVVAKAIWERPTEIYGADEVLIGLRISNRSDQDLTFDLGNALRISLKPINGPELVADPVPKQFLPKPLKVAAGKSETITLPAHLFHTRTREICLGLESDMGWSWLTHDVKPGKYRLCLSFENMREGNDAWLGKVQTEALDVEVHAAK